MSAPNTTAAAVREAYHEGIVDTIEDLARAVVDSDDWLACAASDREEARARLYRVRAGRAGALADQDRVLAAYLLGRAREIRFRVI